MLDEGYIKFEYDWLEAEPLAGHQLHEINAWRKQLHDLGLIGAYDNGIGFGNISQRLSEGEFVISGSATGHLPALAPKHYSVVSRYELATNKVWCQGPIVASSESMSHAAIYTHCPWANAVMHVHSLPLWEKLCYVVPTTPERVAYGTPEMAKAIKVLLEETALPQCRIFVTAGHKEGIFVFGEDLGAAGAVMLHYV